MEGLRHRGKKETEEWEKDEDVNERPLPSPDAIPLRIGIWIILTTILLYRLLSLHLQVLPSALKTTDEVNHPNSFIGERAEKDLQKLVAIGTKVSGSYECEVLAVRLIREEIKSIASTAKRIHLIQENLQRPKGSFYLAFKPHGFQTLYDNIQNIAVRIGPRTTSNHSILINCHFDTVPESPGASDNGLNCAVLLEVLRKLSRQSTPLKHNIIFLFNGAEETPLQAAHGFITQHIWSKEVRLVVNLDSAGAGGREVLFQAHPDYPWIIAKYGEVVPHPSASLAAQELFESGIIPSDTDYRIFRDFGHIPGVDLAHADNGYIYHTRLDTMDYISPGVYQHTGDNVLALLRALANASELENVAASKAPGSRHFYYDLFGTFMVVYSANSGIFLNVVSTILAVIACWKVFASVQDSQVAGRLSCATGKALFSVLLGASMTILGAIAIDHLAPLSWYSKPQLIIPLYVFPYTATAINVWTATKDSNLRKGLECAYGSLMLSAVLLAVLTFYGVRMSYFLMWILFPSALTTLLLPKVSERAHLAIFGLSSILGLSIFLRNTAAVYNLLIPIAGRAGVTTNTELVIAGLTVIICAVVGSVVIPFLVAVKRPIILVYTLLILHILTLAAIVTTPIGFPYSADRSSPALQRFYIFQTPLKVHGQNGSLQLETSGVVLFPVDRNGLNYVKLEVPQLLAARPLNCSFGPLCGFPVYNGRYVKFANSGKWIDFPPPQIQYPTTFELTNKIPLDNSNNVWRLTFNYKGPDHITIVLSLRPGVLLVDWSLGLGRESANVDGRDTYVVFFTNGQLGDVNQFSIDLKLTTKVNSGFLDLSVVGHYQHLKAAYTQQFSAFLNTFPAWAHITPWITSVDIYSF